MIMILMFLLYFIEHRAYVQLQLGVYRNEQYGVPVWSEEVQGFHRRHQLKECGVYIF